MPRPVCRYCGGPLITRTEGPRAFSVRCEPCDTSTAWYPTEARALDDPALNAAGSERRASVKPRPA